MIGAALTAFVQPIADSPQPHRDRGLPRGRGLVLVVITIQLSISISGLQAQNRELAQAHALLAGRVAELEAGPRDAADQAP